MSGMNLDEALRDLATALEAAKGGRGRSVRLRAARQVIVRQCVAVLGMEPIGSAVGRLGHQVGNRGVHSTGASVMRGAVGPCSRGAWSGAGSVCWRYVRAGGGRIARCAAALRISVRRIDRREAARAGTAARHDRRVDAAAGAYVSELAGAVCGVASRSCCAIEMNRRSACHPLRVHGQDPQSVSRHIRELARCRCFGRRTARPSSVTASQVRALVRSPAQ